jgi:hypothetical protein
MQYTEKVLISYNEDSYPVMTAMHVLDINCPNCQEQYRIPVPTAYTDYRKEAEMWRERYDVLAAEITEMLRYTEMHYNINPNKDKMLEKLENLRQKLLDEWKVE